MRFAGLASEVEFVFSEIKFLLRQSLSMTAMSKRNALLGKNYVNIFDSRTLNDLLSFNSKRKFSLKLLKAYEYLLKKCRLCGILITPKLLCHRQLYCKCSFF